MAIKHRIEAQRSELLNLHTIIKRHFGSQVKWWPTSDGGLSVLPGNLGLSSMSGFITEVRKTGHKAEWDAVGRRFNIVKANTEEAVLSKSQFYTLKRIFKTIEPMASIGAVVPYGTNICHGVVANEIIRRGNNPELKIWLYGAKGGDVMHSVLSDENNHLLADSMRGNKNGWVWAREEGYGKPGDRMDFLHVATVGELYDEFGI